MTDLKICRVCLETNVRMYQILGSEVQDVYEKLTNKKINEERSAHHACYMCFRQLQKCRQLVTKAQRAEELLRQLSTNSTNVSNTKPTPR
ncbi:hypothetical protein O3G_MSEX012359 [Manduca sexta]|uniref:ZAD domain-containing protein n=1 Tax=Manduca sexta TaxID=7130 RepID=A0A921ZQE6_MANSE|nr:hypothetical protein O3G_MSEX012359 [Manduca sexta]